MCGRSWKACRMVIRNVASGKETKHALGVKLSVDDFLAIADGTFDGRLAVASERIEIDGDLTAAENLLAAIEPTEE